MRERIKEFALLFQLPRNDPETDPLGTILERLAGIRPEVALRKDDRTAMRDVEVFRWENGENEILALFRQGGKGEPVTVTLPRTGYVYDIKYSKLLGHLREFRTEILPDRAGFFAVTNQETPPFKVQLAGSGQRGKVAMAILTMPEAKGAHAMLLTARFPAENRNRGASSSTIPPAPTAPPPVRHPAAPAAAVSADNTVSDQYDAFLNRGAAPPFMQRVVLVGDEPVIIDIPIAFNDPPGDYEISVTELFTQKTITENWQVQ